MRPLPSRLAITTALIGLALAGCAGSTDDNAGLPTADDLGVETSDEPMTSGMCADGEPDCEDTLAAEGDGGAAAGSCLVGDENCTDESYDGQDVTRAVVVQDAFTEQPSPATRGATSGSTGARIEEAVLRDDTTLELSVIGNPCMLVEDVLVTESPAEVRVLVLTGMDQSVEACEDVGQSWSVEVELDAPLGDRVLLDLAG